MTGLAVFYILMAIIYLMNLVFAVQARSDLYINDKENKAWSSAICGWACAFGLAISMIILEM